MVLSITNLLGYSNIRPVLQSIQACSIQYIIIVLFLTLTGMASRDEYKKKELQQSTQALLVLVGFITGFIWILLTNVLVPLVWVSSDSLVLGQLVPFSL